MEKHDYYIIELSSFQLDNMYKFRANIAVLMNITPTIWTDTITACRSMWMPNSASRKTRLRKMLSSTGTTTPSSAENWKARFKSHPYPFAAVKEDGAIAYVEDGEVEINEPVAFNMEQEELALQGPTTCITHWLPVFPPTLQVSAKKISAKPCPTSKGTPSGKGGDHARGVQFINDSKATNVNSCWYAYKTHDNQNHAYPRWQRQRE